jgi:hypothetical protein
MNMSSIMGAQLSQLQQTVSLSMLNMAQATQAAGTMVMLQDFANAQAAAQAPHPTLGKRFDASV